MGRARSNPANYRNLSHAAPLLILFAAATAAAAPASPSTEPAQELVRETVYNELHDHHAHGYWRYWISESAQQGAQLAEVVETPAGPIKRVVLNNGHPLDAQNSQVERTRLEELANSPDKQASQRQAYAQGEKRVSRIMAMLPDAFCFDDLGEQDGVRHLRFRPNASYSAHNVEARVFHALNGDLWIDTRVKRMTRLEGHLDQNLTFGLGLLARVNRGSWFRMQRTQVSDTEWKTDLLQIHIDGRLVLFKNIARDTSELHGGFARVPSDLSVAQGVQLLEQTDPGAAAQFAPASFTHGQ